jgi:NADPH-dependent curcumin reductase CurA
MDATYSNKQVRLAARPVGLPRATDWHITTESLSSPAEDEVLIKTLSLSLDPAMRGWMNEGRSYIAPVGIGEVMRANGIGIVVDSNIAEFPAGMHLAGWYGVQQYLKLDRTGLKGAAMRPVDTALAPIEKWLNALGGPGMTAYFGLLDVGRPNAGETVVVSGAAGAVGQTVGQIAKIKGCRVVGIAGGAKKCEFVVKELGFDACIDYKAGTLREGLKTHCPDGVDVYFDNVGGEILDTVLTKINRHARIVICGAISQYNSTSAIKGPANYLSLLVNRARMEGMVVFDYAPRFGEAIQAIGGWMKDGRLRSLEDVVDGIDAFPDTLLKLFNGENFGKLILRVATA